MIKLNDKGLSVFAIQTLLGASKTGKYDFNTKIAVQEFQRKHGLIQDGIVGSKTNKALLNAMLDSIHSSQDYTLSRVIKPAIVTMETGDVYNTIKPLFSITAQQKLLAGIAKILHNPKELQFYGLSHFAYFFGNVRQEVGYNYHDVENLNYSVDGLVNTFRAFRNNKSLARKYGRSNGHKANQMMIANIAYADKYGNGSVESNDGWSYKGAGAMQLTFKNNNKMINDYANKHLEGLYVDFLMSPEAKTSIPYSVVSGALYWASMGLGNKVKDNDSVSKDTSYAITKVINRYTKSYDKRWNNTKKIAKLMGLKVYE